MMRQVEFTVQATPAPQGSKSARSFCGQEAAFCPNCKKRHLVNVNVVEVSKRVKPWRDAVSNAASREVGRGWVPIAGPVILSVVFSLARPKYHFRSGKSAHLLKESAPTYPIGVPDISKLVRSTEDALTMGRVWADDALVVECRSTKLYAGTDHPGALDVPGAWIQVTTVNGDPTA